MNQLSLTVPDHIPIPLNEEIAFDLPTLIETRLIIQANSGGGKTWALRRLLEQSHGQVQHIVIDVEGSLRTLRERFEYLLLGSETDEVDYPITPENASLLALKLLEVRTSVIVDLYEFLPSVRQHIVRRFLDALVNAPKPLWHDCLVVVDEAHIFAPEHGSTEAKPALEALCSRGRARGFCAVLATQRISKLAKDPLAECNNKLIGRTSLDNDMKRSNPELEFATKSQVLKKLAPGEFYVFGPAISSQVQKISIGPVLTTHPKAGSRREVSSPPPLESLKEVLATLQALPLPTTPARAIADPQTTTQSDRSRRERATSRKQRDREGSPALPTPATRAVGQQPGVVPSPLQHPEVAALLAEKDAQIQCLQAQIETLGRIKVSLDGSLLALTDLPTVLHLDTLHTQVQQAVIEIRSEAAAGLPPLTLAASPQEEEPAEEQAGGTAQGNGSQPLFLYSEQKLLERLAKQVRALSPSEKALFAWLIEHDETKVSSQQLADAVSMDVRYTWSGQTSKLVKLPFIGRWGAHQFWYQAMFGQYCRKYFASVPDHQFIRRHLLAAAGFAQDPHSAV